MERSVTRRCVELSACVLLHFLLLWTAPNLHPSWYLWGRLAAYLLPSLMLYLLYGKKHRLSLHRTDLTAGIGALGGCCALSLLIYLWQTLASAPVTSAKQSFSVFCAVTLAAFGEELFYRLTLLPALLTVMRGRALRHGAVWLTTALFAVWHTFPYATVFALGCGAILGYLTLRCGNGWIALFVHLAVNWIAFVLSEQAVGVQGICYGAFALLGGISLLWGKRCWKKEVCADGTDTGSDLYA